MAVTVQEVFVGLDRAFQDRQEGEWAEQVCRKGAAVGTRSWPGCTAITAIIHHNALWIANAGAAVFPAHCSMALPVSRQSACETWVRAISKTTQAVCCPCQTSMVLLHHPSG